MGVPKRRRPAIQSRRRAEDEGEDESGAIPEQEDDSASEISAGSDADEDADGEASDDSGLETREIETRGQDSQAIISAVNGEQNKAEDTITSTASVAETDVPTLNADTDAMLNGLAGGDKQSAEGIDFEEATKEIGTIATPVGPSAFSEARRKEHEEYKRRRDADPAFVPNRGGFFMHDQRSVAPLQNGFRPFGRGGARGRGMPHGSFGLSHNHISSPADQAWSHDLHESVAAAKDSDHPKRTGPQEPYRRQQSQHSGQNGAQNRDFSTTNHLGDMQIRFFIQGMSEPKDFSGVKRFSYTRLPFHRPPLRRDKPVRVSIPQMDIKYIFPSPERSFIFIPRALRPNQQGFGKIKGRGSFGANYIGYGPLSSRRSSIYGGSNYSPNAGLSRRSSIARDFTASATIPAAPQNLYKQPTNAPDTGRPVVRLPPPSEPLPAQGPSATPSVVSMVSGPSDYRQGSAELPMHHPRPERSLQVSDIVAPVVAELNQPLPPQQPFHQQMPGPIPPQAFTNPQLRYPHSRHPSHPSQASAGTPLPQIPEAATHAQPFQPFGFPPQQAFYPQQYPMYFYPTDPQQAVPPSYMPNQPYYYPMAMAPQAATATAETGAQGGTIAQEADGMVFYSYPTESAAAADSIPTFQPSYPADAMSQSPFYPPNPVVYSTPPPPSMQ